MLMKIWGKRIFIHFLWECKFVQPLWKTLWRLLKKLKIELLHDPAIPLLGIHLKEYKERYSRCLHIDVFCSTVHNSQAMEITQVPYQ
jgi:hypothetical protein